MSAGASIPKIKSLSVKQSCQQRAPLGVRRTCVSHHDHGCGRRARCRGHQHAHGAPREEPGQHPWGLCGLLKSYQFYSQWLAT